MGLFGNGNSNQAAPVVKEEVEKKIDEAVKAKNDALRNARKAALAVIVAYVKEMKDVPADITAALKTLQPLRNRGTGAVVETVQDRMKGLLAGRKFFTGAEAYAKYKWGTSDGRRAIALCIKTGEPAKRLWIEYNGQADEFQLIGEGARPPQGWTGLVPPDAV